MPSRDLELPAAPADASESTISRHVEELWAEILKLDRVDKHVAFSALGGDSLALARLATARTRLGCFVPLNILSPSQTVQSMAEAIQRFLDHKSPEALAQPQSLFALNEGVVLANELRAVCPVYHTALSREEVLQLRTIERMATCIVDKIRAVQPRGPYRLCGYCAEAVVAYEAAQQLLAQGDEVDQLLLLDPTPVRVGSDSLQRAAGRARFFATRTQHHLGRVRQLRAQQLPAYLAGRLRAFCRHVVPARRESLLTHDIVATTIRSYRPQPYPQNLTVIVTEELRAADIVRCWGELAAALDIRVVPGEHLSMFMPPHVSVLASMLTEILL